MKAELWQGQGYGLYNEVTSGPRDRWTGGPEVVSKCGEGPLADAEVPRLRDEGGGGTNS